MGLALVIATPVILLDAVLWAVLRRAFRNQPDRVRLVDTYVPWATVLIATVLFAFMAWPLALGFVVVAAMFAVFGRRMDLPFGFPIYSSQKRH